MESLFQDVRFGMRMLRKSPGFAAIAVLTLALGIGANIAVFTLVDALVLKLPFPEPQELALVMNHYESGSTPTSLPDFLDLRQQNTSFQQLVATFGSGLTYRGKEEPQRIHGAYFSQDYFKTLGFQPLIGRVANEEEHRLKAPQVCLLGEQFWNKEFASDPHVMGQVLSLGDGECTVIGVMPKNTPDFRLNAPDVWVPLESHPPFDRRGTNYLTVIGRLKPGVDLQGATANLQSIQRSINSQFPGNAHNFDVQPLTTFILGDIRPLLMVLIAAVCIVLLIACANVANLLLARGTGRAKEFAIREAVGARRIRLVRQLLTEGLILSLVAAAIGVLLTVWAVQLFLRYWPADIHRPDSLQIDWRVLLFSVGVAVVATALAALLPALGSSRLNLNTTLKESGQQTSSSAGNRRLRNSFVTVELALSVLLLVGCLLTLRSFDRIIHSDSGFQTDRIITATVNLPNRYTEEQSRAFYSQLLDRLKTSPGVESAAAAAYMPLGAGGQTGGFRAEGHTYPPGQGPVAEENFVTPEYFQTLSIQLIKGRYFTEQDRPNSPKVVVINQYMAEQLWPGQDPIGKKLGALLPEDQWQEVVGVVRDVKSNGAMVPAIMQVYLPFYQLTPSGMMLAVRAKADPSSLGPVIKQAVHELDPTIPIANMSLMDELAFENVSRPRSATILMSIFAGISLLLAAVGLYGVMAYSVGQRAHEFGIRLAMGATSADIFRTVLRAAALISILGILAGIVAAILLTRFMRALLYGISATDPVAFALAVGFLLLIALLASYIPARRATKVDPMVALRYE